MHISAALILANMFFKLQSLLLIQHIFLITIQGSRLVTVILYFPLVVEISYNQGWGVNLGLRMLHFDWFYSIS